MGKYEEYLMTMTSQFILASNIAVNQGHYLNACLFYEQLNAILPPADVADNSTVFDNSVDSSILQSTGPNDVQTKSRAYRVDLTDIRPKPLDPNSTQPEFTQSLSMQNEYMIYFNKLFPLILNSIGEFLADVSEKL